MILAGRHLHRSMFGRIAQVCRTRRVLCSFDLACGPESECTEAKPASFSDKAHPHTSIAAEQQLYFRAGWAQHVRACQYSTYSRQVLGQLD